MAVEKKLIMTAAAIGLIVFYFINDWQIATVSLIATIIIVTIIFIESKSEKISHDEQEEEEDRGSSIVTTKSLRRSIPLNSSFQQNHLNDSLSSSRYNNNDCYFRNRFSSSLSQIEGEDNSFLTSSPYGVSFNQSNRVGIGNGQKLMTSGTPNATNLTGSNSIDNQYLIKRNCINNYSKFSSNLPHITPDSFLGNMPKVSFEKKYQPIVRNCQAPTVKLSMFGSSTFKFSPKINLDSILETRDREPTVTLSSATAISRKPLMEQYQPTDDSLAIIPMNGNEEMMDDFQQEERIGQHQRKRTQAETEEDQSPIKNKTKRKKDEFAAYMARYSTEINRKNATTIVPTTGRNQRKNNLRLNSKIISTRPKLPFNNEISSSYSSMSTSISGAIKRKKGSDNGSPESKMNSKIQRSLDIKPTLLIKPNVGIKSTMINNNDRISSSSSSSNLNESNVERLIDDNQRINQTVTLRKEINSNLNKNSGSNETSKENNVDIEKKATSHHKMNILEAQTCDETQITRVVKKEPELPKYLHTIEEHGRDKRRQRKRLGHLIKAASPVVNP